MKQLLILRHAKSDWDAQARNDHERPLNERGRRAAREVGQFLKRSGRVPDHVITSSAQRAADTVERARQAGDWPCRVETDARLYEATVADVLSVVSACDDAVGRLLIAGHEPTSSGVVSYLTGAAVRFPTAALAAVALPVESWSELEPEGANAGIGELRWLVVPKLIGPVL